MSCSRTRGCVARRNPDVDPLAAGSIDDEAQDLQTDPVNADNSGERCGVLR